ncbi:MAG TPA: 4-alpha-glucanotransferase, partial [Porticoccaceae bacterium]|nr:4-alpha-glucanotransferase [Porticoccaceae bacterium]
FASHRRHYQWSAMQADGFSWWCERLETQLRLYDLVRLDHFRGLQASWEIPADSVTAEQGVWREAPGYALLESLKAGRHEIPLVAEDLGLITPEVLHLRDDFSLPGMAVLQFAFDGGSDNPYLPHNLEKHSVLYTGTHDNDTSLGWFNRLAQDQSVRVRSYLRCLKKDMPGALVASALASVAQWAVIPLQDILELGTSHRINTPGTRTGNWRWRFQWQQLTEQHAFDLRTQIDLYGR